MCSTFNNWITNIYNFLTFYGFGRNPLFDIEDKYTDPPVYLMSKEEQNRTYFHDYEGMNRV